jgi:hypothetical protein
MLITKELSDAVRLLHVNTLSSSVGMKDDIDMALMD